MEYFEDDYPELEQDTIYGEYDYEEEYEYGPVTVE